MKRLSTFILIVLVLGLSAFYFKTGSFGFLNEVKNYRDNPDKKEAFMEGISNLTDAIKKEISNPAPLIGLQNSLRAHLTHDGIISWTNAARKNTSSLPPLSSNKTLDAIARVRLNDMFQKQYFEHTSPQGIGATDIAKDVGYDYISIGENIALGNFEDDKALVDAWMNSPGHRANILNTRFTEIGVAAATGTYKGKETWIAVQIFGKPNTCTYADASLKSKIESSTSVLNDGKLKIAKLSGELEAMKTNSNVNREEYNTKVEEYNTLAHELNSLSSTIKTMVGEYNKEVALFNACIEA